MMRALKDVVLLILRIRLGPGHQNKIQYIYIYFIQIFTLYLTCHTLLMRYRQKYYCRVNMVITISLSEHKQLYDMVPREILRSRPVEISWHLPDA